MATIDAVLTRLATIVGNVSGVTTASIEFPSVIADTALPYALIYEGTAQYTRMSANGYRVTRQIIIELFVKNAPVDTDRTQRNFDTDVRPFLQSIPAALMTARRLESSDAGLVANVELVSDTGLGILSWPPNSYAGTFFTLQITTQERY